MFLQKHTISSPYFRLKCLNLHNLTLKPIFMKRFFTLPLALLATTLLLAAPQSDTPLSTKNDRILQRGYRGSVLFDTGLAPSEYFQEFTLGLSTVHGYQFSPHLFLGAGVGIIKYFESSEMFGLDISDNATCAPVFLNLNICFIRNWITPYLDLRAGYAFGDWESGYYNPTLGVRFGFRRGFGLNCGIGYTIMDKGYYDFVTFRFGIEF